MELLTESKKLPEFVITMKINFESLKARLYREEDIVNDVNKRKEELRAKRKKEKEDERKKLLDEAEGEEAK